MVNGTSRKRKRSGGQRQRLRAMLRGEQLNCKSALCNWLLSMFAWGHFSVQRVQNISSLLMTDLKNAETNDSIWTDLEELSKLGTSGLYANKMHAELMGKCNHLPNLPEPYAFDVQFQPPLAVQKQEMLAPHECFAALYHRYPSTWKKTMVPDESHAQRFWNATENHPCLVESPLKTEHPSYKTKCVPILLHGDGVPIVGIGKGWSKIATIFSWCSMLTAPSTKESMRFIWGAFDKLCKPDGDDGSFGTFTTFFQVLCWSLQCLYSGKWPHRNHLGQLFPPTSWRAKLAGRDLAGGFTGYLFATIGDMDYFASILQLPNYSWAKGPCSICRCTLGGEHTWTDFRKTAAWIGTEWTKADWFSWGGRSMNPLFNQLPGQSCHTVSLDLMHCKYLGHDMYFYGSVLTLLCQYILPGTDEANLQTCWGFLKRYYKEHKIPSPYRYLTKVSMFIRKKKFPKLRGKASEVRHLAKPLSALWRHFMNGHVVTHRQIDLYLRLNIRFENILDDYKDHYAFPAAAHTAFVDTAFSMMQLSSQLADHFVDEGIAMFDMTSKAHSVLHIAMLSKHINPRATWCFRGEDMMQKAQALLQSCVRGNNGALCFRKMLSHYRFGLHLLFEEHKDWKSELTKKQGLVVMGLYLLAINLWTQR